MRKTDLVRAWKDPVYRASLEAERVGGIPAHPSGLVDLTDGELRAASGLAGPVLTTAMTCTEYTFRGWRYCCPK